MSYNKKQKKIENASKKRFWHKKQIIIAVFVFVAIGISVGVWMLLYVHKQTTSLSQTTEVPTDITNIVNNAEKLANSGKIDSAKSAYDDAIKKTSNSYLKSTLLLSKATLSFNDGKYDDALTTANEAESASPSDTVSSFIAQIYEKKGDSKNAIKYYQKAISMVDKTQPMSTSDIKYYQSKIDMLSKAVN